jgi:3-oxoacyl-[acyl-carrier protein] reductase
MLLESKTAVVYGGGGAIGGAAARAFAREGAQVHLAGRTPAKLEAVAREIRADGGSAEIARLDALDEAAVRDHADAVAAGAGGIDVALNAIGIPHVQGTPFAELSLDDYLHPITAYCRTNFVTAQAAARHMVAQGSGVILTISTSGSRLAVAGAGGYLGYGTACAAIEATTRILAAELGPSGVRVVCLMPEMIPEAGKMGSHSRAVFQPVAERLGLTLDEFLAAPADRTLLGRWPTLADVAEAAAFAASDRAAATTGTVVNLTAGSIVD